ncbi:MAG: helix-turn-helix transcriptional regulator [Cyclobacteriaceae bacterium]
MDDRICQVLDYIEDHLDSKLSLEHLAQVACMSESHFHRSFKKETGRTSLKFIEEIKMSKAYGIIISGSKKVHEITSELGYSDYETFSRVFKKYHFIAPDDLKAIAQKIKSDTGAGSDELIIKTLEVDDVHEIELAMEHLADKLRELYIAKGLTEDDIKNAKVMSITPKGESTIPHQQLVKNKFIVQENQKIWQQLLNKIENGNS